MNSNNISWDDQDWKNINYHVRKIQKRISEAAKNKDWHRVKSLQKLVINSYDCRTLAVHRVTCRKNIRTPGLDGKFWHSDNERYEAVNRLKNLKHYKPKPFKRFLVPKDHDKSKTRPLSVPTIYDRAVQALILIALDPVVEILADEHAYGFRKCRSAQDAIKDIYDSFGLDKQNTWFLRTDVKECFDHLSHAWLLKHIPMDKTLLKKILECGYVTQNKFYPTTEGMPQGGVLSPVITTFALSGFEKIIRLKYPEVHMVRFVDDFIFASKSKEILEQVLADFKIFLHERGLTISDYKTKIAHISEGFDFIGWHFAYEDNKLILKPSNQSVQELKIRLYSVITQARRWTTRKLIIKLNGIIIGWSQYHMYLCNNEQFLKLDDWLDDLLWHFVLAKHPNKSTKWIYTHHWKLIGNRKIFASNDVQLLKFSDISIRIPKKLNLLKNPYIDKTYFRNRMKDHYCFKKM